MLEYWVVDPERKSVFVYRMDAATNKFVAQLPIFTDEDTLDSSVFEGLEIVLEEVFPKE